MKYLYQNNIPGMVKFWKLLEAMVEENYVTEENEDDYLVFGIVNYWNIEQIKQYYLQGISYRKLIVYQLEPLNHNHWWGAEQIIKNIQGADEIWDYDLENIEFLQKEGFDPKFRPCRYTNSLKRIETVEDPKIDVLLYASPTDSRINYFNHLCHNKTFEYNCAWMTGINGDSLDYFMANSKIILNLATQYENSRQAQTRIFDALINNKCVISQNAKINYFGDSLIQFNDPHEMMFKIESVLREGIWRKNEQDMPKPSIFYNVSKIAVFIYIDQNQLNWEEKFIFCVRQIQNCGLYDSADYIQISFSNDVNLNINFYKVNRIRFNQQTALTTAYDLYNFSYLNPGYKSVFFSNTNDENFEHLLQCINNWRETIPELDSKNLIEFSNQLFWINSNFVNSNSLESIKTIVNLY
jgi:hypothetical protein